MPGSHRELIPKPISFPNLYPNLNYFHIRNWRVIPNSGFGDRFIIDNIWQIG
jgi:hypothetical protein